jgi:hypothetical protein
VTTRWVSAGSGTGGSFGPLSGDVTTPAAGSDVTTLAAIQGSPVLLGTPVAGQVLVFNGTQWVNGGSQSAEVSANTALSPTTPVVNVTATSANVTITLPTAIGAQTVYTVSLDPTSTFTVVLATTGGQTVNKAAASTITWRPGISLDFWSNNANWVIH